MRIFVSYRRRDTLTVVGRIDDHLRREFGNENVFRDIDSIPVGADFASHIQVELEACDLVLAIIGKNWLTARAQGEVDFVRIELETALRRDIVVIPVLVDGATLPDSVALPAELGPLSLRQAFAIDSGRDFRRQMEELMAALRARSAASSGARGKDRRGKHSTDAKRGTRRSAKMWLLTIGAYWRASQSE